MPVISMLMPGIVGLYVGRIHTEVKNRPLYMVGRAVGFSDAARDAAVRDSLPSARSAA